MLQGLGRLLRKCGIDTVILENQIDHMECVRYYQDDKRFILTRGQIFNKVSPKKSIKIRILYNIDFLL